MTVKEKEVESQEQTILLQPNKNNFYHIYSKCRFYTKIIIVPISIVFLVIFCVYLILYANTNVKSSHLYFTKGTQTSKNKFEVLVPDYIETTPPMNDNHINYNIQLYEPNNATQHSIYWNACYSFDRYYYKGREVICNEYYKQPVYESFISYDKYIPLIIVSGVLGIPGFLFLLFLFIGCGTCSCDD